MEQKLINSQDICNKCLSSSSMEICLFRKCPLWFGSFKTKEEMDEIIKTNHIKLND